jgi:itaconate CoA-transferase
MQPLRGMTVVALEHAVAAPLATRHLADLGARVIKIERPREGDFARNYDSRARGLSSFFVWCNRGKESVTLDLKAPEGLQILRALLARADVLVQNLAPGAMSRLGLDPDVLARECPRLIACDISGYGSDGPYTDWKAYDLLIQAEAGLLDISGTRDVPSKAGISVADIAAAMYALTSVLAAVLDRAATGRGRRIEISMLESLTEWMGFAAYWGLDGGRPPPRSGAAHATIFPYGPVRCRDGTVMLAVQHDREWRDFAQRVLNKPELADDPRFASNTLRSEHRDELQAEIEARLTKLSRDEALRLLQSANIACSIVRTPGDLWTHPQLRRRGRIRTVRTSNGPLPAFAPPLGAVADGAELGAVPSLGEHTRAVLAEFGWTSVDVDRLAQAGVI